MKLIESPKDFAEWCDQSNFSKEELARILGITRQTLYNLTHPKQKASAYSTATESTQIDLAGLSKLPPMLSLSLFAIESLGAEFFGHSTRFRKRARRSI
jgi:hypothetical protein